MKRIIAIICTVMIIGALCCGCALVPKWNTDPTPASSTEAASTQEAQATQEIPATASANNETQVDVSSASVSDYVREAKESVVVQPGGGEKRFRIPEILLGSKDAAAANSEIIERYGSYFDDPYAREYVISMDYEAYLYDRILSVFVKNSVDGGNSNGLCYSFDITTGDKLNNETLCSMTGRDYNAVIDTLTTNLTAYYDEKYSGLPANDEMRSKTLSSDNINASVLFLDGSHRLTAMVNLYAAVGGGNWVDTIPAE